MFASKADIHTIPEASGAMESRLRTGDQVFIVAEIANAHGGHFQQAKELIQASIEAGADAVKIQMIRADHLVVRSHPRHQHFANLEFSDQQWRELLALATQARVPVLADVFDSYSIPLLVDLGVAGLKIHATDTCHQSLICEVAQARLPVLLSAGGAFEEELAEAIRLLETHGPCLVVLMHGYQAYPTDPRDLHLRRIVTLRDRFGIPVGLQDHLDADDPLALWVPLVALQTGIAVVEKHITLNRAGQGIDYYSALNPDEFRTMVEMIRQAERLLGRAELVPSAQELAYRHLVRKVMVSTTGLTKGQQISQRTLTGKRADHGLPLAMLPQVVDRVTRSAVEPDTPLLPEQVEWNTVVMIAVRMHSTRLPGKALVPIADRPAIEWLIEQLKRATLPKRIILCTSTTPEDQVLRPIADRMRIGYFAGSEDDVMDRFLQAAEQEQAEHIVRVTGDDIVVDPEYLDRLILYHIQEQADYSCIPGLPKGTESEVMSVAALKKAYALAEDSSWSEYMTWYLKVPDVFRVREMPVKASIQRPQYRVTLDYPEDLEVLRQLYGLVSVPDRAITVEEIVQCLDHHPDILSINATVPAKPLPPNLNVRLNTEAVHA